ncbi:nitric oxide reductase NorF protein [Sinorhizobium kostiense]|uniref:Nitric oxide reductase NorF protein n=1 Tax=Sinorhizobium kostiense TaxID=76747 RepID=A0ABS4QWC2_9HYPH|nr:cytochrome C oxidase subunit IV family protein [Sinorhizobium kostiense]MBP2234939.1 nitric oxide reductase NorF protein [Sinorhizobium kostiense]
MSEFSPNSLMRTWICLLVMVFFGMLLAREFQDPTAPLGIALALLLLALAKARLVILDFLGLRSGPRPLRLGLLAWPAFFTLAAAAKALITAVLLAA